MEQGTLGELYLTRSVTKHIRKHNKAVRIGAGVGKDYSLFETEGECIISTEAVGESPYMAWVKALNNFYTSGGEIAGARVCYMLPTDIEESQLKTHAAEFNSLADQAGIQIIGGNTRVSSAYNKASFLVEAMGHVSEQQALCHKAESDYHIVMAGFTAVLGTNLIIDYKREELKSRFAESYIKEGEFPHEYSIRSMVDAIKPVLDEAGVVYMHDVSYGGVYGALWQLGEALRLGINVDHRSIPIKQETIEICNYFDLNPYMLEGTGALLMAARDGEAIVDAMNMVGIKASVIGRMTQNKDRIVVLNSEGEKRFLSPVKGDEIYKVISAY